LEKYLAKGVETCLPQDIEEQKKFFKDSLVENKLQMKKCWVASIKPTEKNLISIPSLLKIAQTNLENSKKQLLKTLANQDETVAGYMSIQSSNHKMDRRRNTDPGLVKTYTQVFRNGKATFVGSRQHATPERESTAWQFYQEQQQKSETQCNKIGEELLARTKEIFHEHKKKEYLDTLMPPKQSAISPQIPAKHQPHLDYFFRCQANRSVPLPIFGKTTQKTICI
jgi:hypothetical protein